jgi:hypothetical protein
MKTKSSTKKSIVVGKRPFVQKLLLLWSTLKKKTLLSALKSLGPEVDSTETHSNYHQVQCLRLEETK